MKLLQYFLAITVIPLVFMLLLILFLAGVWPEYLDPYATAAAKVWLCWFYGVLIFRPFTSFIHGESSGEHETSGDEK